MYVINLQALKAGPKLSGQSKAYLAGVAAAKWVGKASHATAHKVGVGAVGAYHVGKRVGRFHPLNMVPHKETFGPTDAETTRIYRMIGINIQTGKKNVGGPPVYSTRTETKQSRGGEHTASSRTPAARKSMRGPSAPRRRREEEAIYKRRK